MEDNVVPAPPTSESLPPIADTAPLPTEDSAIPPPQTQEDTPMTAPPQLDGPTDTPQYAQNQDSYNTNPNVNPTLSSSQPYHTPPQRNYFPFPPRVPQPQEVSPQYQTHPQDILNLYQSRPQEVPSQYQTHAQEGQVFMPQVYTPDYPHPYPYCRPRNRQQQLTYGLSYQDAAQTMPNGLPAQAQLQGSLTSQAVEPMQTQVNGTAANGGVSGFANGTINFNPYASMPPHSPYAVQRPQQQQHQTPQTYQQPQPQYQQQTQPPLAPRPPSTASTPAPTTTSIAATGPGTGAGRQGTPTAPAVSANVAQAAPIIPSVNGAHGSPTRVYLNQKVTPVLLEGMKILAVKEPERPLEWLGEYLLKRSREIEEVGGVEG